MSQQMSIWDHVKDMGLPYVAAALSGIVARKNRFG